MVGHDTLDAIRDALNARISPPAKPSSQLFISNCTNSQGRSAARQAR